MVLPLTLAWLLYLMAFVLGLSSIVLYSMSEAVLVDWEICWINLTPVELSVFLDGGSLLFVSVVGLISGSVVHFTGGYMEGEAYLHRFLHILMGFIASMVIFVLSPNLMVMLLGWDGLGLVSYLLVVYYQASSSLSSGMVVVLTNRIGDVGVLFGIAFLLSKGYWTSPLISNVSPGVAMAVGLGGLTKSAQFPFSAWLPLAMAAPTPVSALVHSSTLVTAGVYLVIRLFGAVESLSWGCSALLLIGVVTMVMAGLAAMGEMDMKKVVALSTLSQLGVMFCALGLHSPFLAFFHLLTHAMFKALLFLCVGTYIHYQGHSQDLRTMGNLSSLLPVTQTCSSIAHLALGGFPFLAAFYSKDPIFEASLGECVSPVFTLLFAFACGLTVSYSVRASVAVQFGPNAQLPVTCLHNEKSEFTWSTCVLSVGAIVWGAVLNWLFTPTLLSSPTSLLSALIPLIGIMLGSLLGAMPVIFKVHFHALAVKTVSFISFLSSLWFITPLTSQPGAGGVLSLSSKLSSTVDQGWLEGSTSGGVNYLAQKGAGLVESLRRKTPMTLLGVAVIAVYVPGLSWLFIY